MKIPVVHRIIHRFLSAKDSQTWSATQTKVTDYMSQNLPQVIQGKMTWEDYVAGMEANDPSSVCELLQKQIDKSKIKDNAL